MPPSAVTLSIGIRLTGFPFAGLSPIDPIVRLRHISSLLGNVTHRGGMIKLGSFGALVDLSFPSPLRPIAFVIISSISGMEKSLILSSLFEERTSLSFSLCGERTVTICLFSMKEGLSSESIPRKISNLLAGLSFCVAVFTGPENASGFVSTKPEDGGWCSTSLFNVTKSQHFGFVVKSLSTHSSFGTDLLSIFHEDHYLYAFRSVVVWFIIVF